MEVTIRAYDPRDAADLADVFFRAVGRCLCCPSRTLDGMNLDELPRLEFAFPGALQLGDPHFTVNDDTLALAQRFRLVQAPTDE